jgi:hypothetical protein
MRYGAPRIGRSRRHNTIVDEQVIESELSFVSCLKNSLSIASRGARQLGTPPENCRLLPFCRPKTATPVSTVAFPAPSGHAGQPGPRAENRERAERSLGEKQSPSAVCSMTGESTNSQ